MPAVAEAVTAGGEVAKNFKTPVWVVFTASARFQGKTAIVAVLS